jgi:diguanylate cyclase (GGDEF)-like protein
MLFNLNTPFGSKSMLQSQKQALRLRRAWLANLGLMLCIPICLSASLLGYASVSHVSVVTYVSVMWLGHLLIVSLIYFNWNLRLKDASLTIIQMVWSIAGLSGLMYIMSDIRILMLMACLLVMTFGSLKLSFQGFQGMMIYSVGCYLIVLYCLQKFSPEKINIGEEFFTFIGFILVLAGFVFMGAESSNLRKVVSQRHKELKAALARIEDLAITDELTGLINRRNLLSVLTQQRALCNRGRYSFTVCYLGLDHFKKVNDQYGHLFADKVLKAFSKLVIDNLREVDVGARVGSQKFVLILANTQMSAAKNVCERMAQNWRDQEFLDVSGLTYTFSGGIVEYKSPETIEQLLERAETLLLEAKLNGRNCLVTEYQDLQVPLDLNVISSL